MQPGFAFGGGAAAAAKPHVSRSKKVLRRTNCTAIVSECPTRVQQSKMCIPIYTATIAR